MSREYVAVSQFDGTVNVLKLKLSTGEAELVTNDEVDEDQVAFGLFDFEKNGSEIEALVLLATPDGPILIFKDSRYRPEFEKTSIEIEEKGDFSHLLISHDENPIFSIFYESKFGIGLHPYNKSREDIDFYYWLSKKIQDQKFYQVYTKEIIYMD